MASLSPRHDGHDMDMGDDMSMGGGSVPTNDVLQQQFWIVIGSVIAFAALVNVLDKVLLWQRSRSKTAKPSSLFWISIATITAISRELYSASMKAMHIKSLRLRSPLVGQVVIVLAYFITVLVFSFYGLDTTDKWSWEDVAVRVGTIAQAQFPLIFLLAGKQNIIGFFTGLGYERLNWLHRWVARILWVSITMHMAFFFRSWMRWHYITVKLKSDNMTQTGFAAWWILTAIVGLSFAPIRRWSYEVFVVSHLVLFAGLTGAIMIHVDTGKIYIWIAIGFYFFDRLVRAIVAAFCNLSFLHLKKGFWANQATFTPLPGNVTRITINNPVVSWKPGQHMFLSCHAVVPLQSHPFTVASLATDGKMEFLVQARKGGTKRFHRYASKIQAALPGLDHAFSQKAVGIEGPYGTHRPLHQFDSVILVAGSTGGTFTAPLMRDIVRRWKQIDADAVTRTIRFVWAIKSRDRLVWFRDQLETALEDTQVVRETQHKDLNLEISVYITCEDAFDSENSSFCEPEKVRGQPTTITSENIQQLQSNEKEKFSAVEVISKPRTSSDTGSNSEDDGCGPNGKCCCKTTIEDESDALAAGASKTQCCCSRPLPEASSSSSLTNSQTKPSVQSATIKILSGRPHARNIIRSVLEQAEGESAVVVCGPQGLRDDVRRSVVCLSDERAVHKGTGAQGIYLHVEGFGY